MNLSNGKTVFAAPDRKANYYTIILYNGLYKLYANTWHTNKLVIYNNSKDGIEFEERSRAVFKRSGVTHNFYPFFYMGKLYGIGGIDSWKNEKKWHTINDYKTFKKEFLKRFNTPYIRDEARFKMFRERIKAKPTLEHTSGLYLFTSDDGHNWKQVQERPIITAWHPGFTSALEWGKSTEFDSQICIVQKGSLYYMYLRSNVKRGTRFIQYSVSENLLNWGEFKNINLDTFDEQSDNYYMPIFYRHPTIDGIYVGFLPYYCNEFCSIRLVKSVDCANWETVGEIFRGDYKMLRDQPKNTVMPVNYLGYENDNVILYFHNNYLGLDKQKDSTIIRFIIPIKEFNRGFKC